LSVDWNITKKLEGKRDWGTYESPR